MGKDEVIDIYILVIKDPKELCLTILIIIIFLIILKLFERGKK